MKPRILPGFWIAEKYQQKQLVMYFQNRTRKKIPQKSFYNWLSHCYKPMSGGKSNLSPPPIHECCCATKEDVRACRFIEILC
ncbi:hypothetical protein [Pseudogulbenkiania ferrooxidans]|uniref:hypothetical protein n=1 Tax=Pseudogulbenkiania ferrooxidans TaxID=549169 RepID=UPI00123762D2|nr:hypothetical protein [Pseudogulbenkiania ferrooxidans]